LAWKLGRTLPGKAAVLSLDGLLQGSIANRADDAPAELEMVHTQLRLLTANYMKNGYHVVAEGPFYYEVHGTMHRFEPEIDQLVSLMRQMTQKALIVRLTARPEVLKERAKANWRDDELAEALAIEALYKPRYGTAALTLDTSETNQDDIAAAIRSKLTGQES
jgi:hypothetical protein